MRALDYYHPGPTCPCGKPTHQCMGCNHHKPAPPSAAAQVPMMMQAPEKMLTVGNAPIHIAGPGVVSVETTDKLGRTICHYEIDPAYKAIADMANMIAVVQGASVEQKAAWASLMAAFLTADDIACETLVDGMIDADATNTIRKGPNGKLYENDSQP